MARLIARATAIDSLSKVAVGEGDGDQLEQAANLVAKLPLGATYATSTWAHAELLAALAMAVRWQPALRAAEPDADRYRRAAIARAGDVAKVGADAGWPAGLMAAAEVLATLTSLDDCVAAARTLRQTPLPVHLMGIFGDDKRSGRRSPVDPPASAPPRAMVLLDIDGEPIDSPMLLRPGRAYKLGVRILMEDWPKDLAAIEVSFLSVMQSIRAGSASLREGQSATSVMLEVLTELSREAGAVELKPVVVVRRTDGSSTVPVVIGHRQLKVKTIRDDILRGLPMMPERLAVMEEEVRARLPTLPEKDHSDWLTLLVSLIRFRKRVLDDGFLGKEAVRLESEFRQQVEWFLEADASVGASLHKGGMAGGGILDLALGNIPLELKVESSKPVTPASAYQYLGQPTQYGSASDTPLSILCILDASPKSLPAGIHSDYLDLIQPKLHGLEDPRYPSIVAFVIVHANFPTPSTFSEMPNRPRRKSKAT